MLNDAGWILTEGASIRTLKTKDTNASSTPQELTLRINVPEQPDLQKVAEALQRFWSLAGAKVEINVSDVREIVANRNHQVYVTNIQISPNQDMKPFWSSTAATEPDIILPT
ncbi:MAG: hypothetical protein H6759_04835 [Candidatus Nomurabacteria bacterium]|nr:MAG: hypothetical protein H6759_04835 [Candidatus Nomurabacteria bacterium]